MLTIQQRNLLSYVQQSSGCLNAAGEDACDNPMKEKRFPRAPSPGSASLQASFAIQTWLPEQVPMGSSVCMSLRAQQHLGTVEMPAKLVGASCTAQKLSVCCPCHAPPQLCLPLGPWPRGKCLTCGEGPRKLFSLLTGLGSCVSQSRSQLGLKPSSNQVWRLLQDHRVDHEALVMLPVPG